MAKKYIGIWQALNIIERIQKKKESPLYEEILTVDTQRLINFAKQYALYGTDIESDVEEMTVVEKKKRGAGK